MDNKYMEERMKVYMAEDEVWPLYTLHSTDKGGILDTEVEINPEFWAEYVKAEAAYRVIQIELRNIWEGK